MTSLSLQEAARQAGVNPFDVVALLALRGVLSSDGSVDEALVPMVLEWAGVETNTGGEEGSGVEEASSQLSFASDRLRILHKMLSKMVGKRKIGGAHTDLHNVYRGLPDDEKGMAKEILGKLLQ
ncbi:MAG TPA: hypothetical protein EYP04_07335, partial [Anaerolineae bacterium]|nr:hypothetical protein [Anaerolineae bacterium]